MKQYTLVLEEEELAVLKRGSGVVRGTADDDTRILLYPAGKPMRPADIAIAVDRPAIELIELGPLMFAPPEGRVIVTLDAARTDVALAA